jgi:hypothetical protein
LRHLLRPAGEARRIGRHALQQGARLLPRGSGFLEMGVIRLVDRLDGLVQGILPRRGLRQCG